MSRPAAALLAASATLLIHAAATAQEVPVVQPSRDVDVTYRVPDPGPGDASLLQRLRWSAASRRQRVDLPTSGGWMVLDFGTHRMWIVRDDTQTVMSLAAPPDVAPSPANFTKGAAAVVASIPCTEWKTHDRSGQETLACYTADGVLLRVSDGTRSLLEAVSVKYAAQPDGIFALPRGYARQEGKQ